MTISIKQITFGSQDYQTTVELRDEVLRQPLGLRFTKEELDEEHDSFHFAAFAGKEIVGCLILVAVSKTELKMRQVAVSPKLQGQGIGKLMVKAAEQFAIIQHFQWMKLSARDAAVKFYMAMGYEVTGEPYIEVTIPHRSMQKKMF